jgi:hypothetical protein
MARYLITEKAGRFVAGHRNTGVGTALELPPFAAAHELRLGTLVPADLAMPAIEAVADEPVADEPVAPPPEPQLPDPEPEAQDSEEAVQDSAPEEPEAPAAAGKRKRRR